MKKLIFTGLLFLFGCFLSEPKSLHIPEKSFLGHGTDSFLEILSRMKTPKGFLPFEVPGQKTLLFIPGPYFKGYFAFDPHTVLFILQTEPLTYLHLPFNPFYLQLASEYQQWSLDPLLDPQSKIANTDSFYHFVRDSRYSLYFFPHETYPLNSGPGKNRLKHLYYWLDSAATAWIYAPFLSNSFLLSSLLEQVITKDFQRFFFSIETALPPDLVSFMPSHAPRFAFYYLPAPDPGALPGSLLSLFNASQTSILSQPLLCLFSFPWAQENPPDKSSGFALVLQGKAASLVFEALQHHFPPLLLQPSPSIRYPMPGDLIVTEVMWMGTYQNQTSQAYDEWIEIKNTSDAFLLLNQLSLRIDDYLVFGPEGGSTHEALPLILPPHSYFLVARSGQYLFHSPLSPTCPLAVRAFGQSGLSNNGGYQLSLIQNEIILHKLSISAPPQAGVNDTTAKLRKSMVLNSSVLWGSSLHALDMELYRQNNFATPCFGAPDEY